MKRRIIRKAILAGITALGLPLAVHAGHTYQTTNVVVLGSGHPVDGAATLYRTEDAVWGTISMFGLDRKSAYTVWAVVWNAPGSCTGGCGADDIGIVGNSVFYTAGFVTGTDGQTTVQFKLLAGDLAEGINVLLGDGIDAGNGDGVEIHFVIRSHGHTIPGMVDAQIGSFAGACDLNACVDQFAAVFPPLPPPPPL